MKHIVWALALSLILAACGKTNTTSSGVSSSVNSTTVTNPVATTDFDTFKTKVANGEFRYPTDNYNFTAYGKSFSTEVEKKKFIGLTFNVSDTSYANLTRNDDRIKKVFKHELAANATELKSKLVSLLSSAASSPAPQSCGVGCYQFYIASEGRFYAIDLNYPLIANPIYSYQNNSGYSYYFWSGLPY